MDLCEKNSQKILHKKLFGNVRLLFQINWEIAQLRYVPKSFRLKTIFARFGIPDEAETDNSPQFLSSEFKIVFKTALNILLWVLITHKEMDEQIQIHIRWFQPLLPWESP